MSKLDVPAYVCDIRKGKNTIAETVDIILQENNITSPPVNVIEIAQNMNFKIFTTAFKDPNIAGIMVDSNKEFLNTNAKRCIILNKNGYKTRNIFTIAHEIGHFVMHCNDSQNFYERYLDGLDKDQNPKAEQMANFFAASLLMPKTMLLKYISDSPYKDNIPKLTEKIADDFLVSTNAASRRLIEINYVKNNGCEQS